MKLILAPAHNTGDKRDATGAFQPEAKAFRIAHREETSVKLFDNSKVMATRFAEVMAWIGNCDPGSVDTLVTFCHGFKSGLQIGATVANAPRFAGALALAFGPRPRIVMYSCDAARDADNDRSDDVEPGPGGEGGYADRLRDELVKRGVMVTIYAHATAGHATWNPWVRRFDPDDLAGGRWIIRPHSSQWSAWKRALRGPLRFRFPYLTQEEIERELDGPGVA